MINFLMKFGILPVNLEIFKSYLFYLFHFFLSLYLQKPEIKYINLEIDILSTLKLEISKKRILIVYLVN